MEPNFKLMLDEMKSLRSDVNDQIKGIHNDVNGLQISLSDRITSVEQKLTNRLINMDNAAKVFADWRPRIDATIDDIRLEMGAMRKTFHRVVLDGDPVTSAGVFNRVGATAAPSPVGNPVVGPNGHRVEHQHWESGIQNPLLVKGTQPSSSVHPFPHPALPPNLFTFNQLSLDHRDGKTIQTTPSLSTDTHHMLDLHGEGSHATQQHH
jgi:hypothetical protein